MRPIARRHTVTLSSRSESWRSHRALPIRAASPMLNRDSRQMATAENSDRGDLRQLAATLNKLLKRRPGARTTPGISVITHYST
jgi:hypothetical protein